ncbi:RdgB/HAM1 family non-canonical purine NTP pyrophosphatase [Thiomicrorhabdus sp. 6S3-12]|uniref:RdgB/HAM1 family non-canonical purine NTP pyrophosphatase n=1 Tax=Thiomicrorhabdus sp. 6S3-12 TaxID=2819681 RepID=UPI001AAD6CC7|nr:RdgB/HAM1 family non-canonical purine NTP pyrophosphatase [Thiomicrorhabdus sp. 6S3-12]MBO1923219.1 RdgB/HAM1 family non-canonical purine NTP pyrophosphatase [Thiomicrorhabdus sp. 6S3-12]
MIVLATGNPYKVAEIEPLLKQAGFRVKLQTDFFKEEVEEDGLSFVENALKKARFASRMTGLPALADDSGLEVDALGGKPGIYSARYAAGANDASAKSSDEENLQKVLADLGQRPYSQRQARYCCVAVYVEHAEDPMPVIGIGQWHGEILMERRTGQGIGYDDIMWIPKLVKTVSEIPFDVKNKISHRAQAVLSVMEQLGKRTEQ